MDSVASTIILVAGILLVVWTAWQMYEGWRASRRAEALVRALLAPQEYQQLVHQGFLEVRSPTHSDRVYHVSPGHGPVVVLEGGVPVARLCLQPTQPLPAPEVVLVHKALIETDEEDYWHRANVMLHGHWFAGTAA